MNDWKVYGPNTVVFPYANRFWQKKIYEDAEIDVKVFIEVVEYSNLNKLVYEVSLHIPAEIAFPIFRNINIKVYSYSCPDLNFEELEADAVNLFHKITGIERNVP